MRQLTEAITLCRSRRRMAGLSQADVARALGHSRALIGKWESQELVPGPLELAAWAAVLGLDAPIRVFDGGSGLRDAGQLRLLARFRRVVADRWRWRTEVPASHDPSERRAIDVVLGADAGTVGVEAISRLLDAQEQARRAQLKQQSAGLDRMILLVADTRHNRQAVLAAAPTLDGSFPLAGRAILAALRAGTLPARNGVVVL
jgi:transcriptional regulator with XRE-family HTH domain